MIVEEGEQVGFAATDPRAVQRVTDPTLVRRLGLEPAEHRHAATAVGVRAHQLPAVEQAQQGGLRG